ncbi:RHS repeat domain-containing protein [Candidatus Pantoea multigeneris]|uniref:RHS repeat domain-containing protein n=1 Tax=Candidatus Pantoea multigeneris TaxID=2608357 RepID=UPI001F044A63|nr:RHS repeat-associated core domain-containing protein [Pantoea multigeneris]
MTPVTLRFGYDAEGRLITRDSADSHTRYRYGPREVTVQRVSQAGFSREGEPEWEETLRFSHDAAGHLLEESGPRGVWRAERDVLGSLTRLDHPDGNSEHFLRYGGGHLLTRQLEHQGCKVETAGYQRDRLHREISRSMGELTLCTRYDVDGHITQRKSAPLTRSSDWRPGGLLGAEILETPGGAEHRRYRYSADGDLLYSRALDDEHFSYDPAGNQTERADQRVWRNLLTRLGNVAQRFDGFGRVWQRTLPGGVRQRLFYNAEHQLCQVQFSGDKVFSHAEYAYDALGRRSHKVLHRHTPPGRVPIPPETVTFIWQGTRLAEERNSLWPDKAVKYLYHEESHEPLARIICEYAGAVQTVEWYHCGLNGRPETLTNSRGDVTWWCVPRGWGGMAREQLMGYGDREPWRQQNLGYQGQYVDRETGLHYNLHRYFCPLTGRFTQPDPIGLAGGINPYQYAPNALGWIDPLGLKCSGPAVKLNRKLSALEKAQKSAVSTRVLPDGRIRYYNQEALARTPGPTRGRSHVTEWNPTNGDVRIWEETYNHSGQVNRVHPKMKNGELLDLPHYPPTKADIDAGIATPSGRAISFNL